MPHLPRPRFATLAALLIAAPAAAQACPTATTTTDILVTYETAPDERFTPPQGRMESRVVRLAPQGDTAGDVEIVRLAGVIDHQISLLDGDRHPHTLLLVETDLSPLLPLTPHQRLSVEAGVYRFTPPDASAREMREAIEQWRPATLRVSTGPKQIATIGTCRYSSLTVEVRFSGPDSEEPEITSYLTYLPELGIALRQSDWFPRYDPIIYEPQSISTVAP
ncbi:hypothetical protein [Pontivivens ytuae]|uniref:Uncharacterized protein n=1 Tax=Pontivivens ytuae TaxID=2789856 RepID=A0A7S9LS60_9RHOB|nr:hypothetical protein [Pontivivens ytuae]QPH53745.1 hypothetical protein I0K15_18510 [Pontivivens ytuae]